MRLQYITIPITNQPIAPINTTPNTLNLLIALF